MAKSTIDQYPLHYEELASKSRPPARLKTTPTKNKISFTRKVREGIKRMSEKLKTRKYAPSRMEVAKTVMIAALITSVIAFVAGISFQKQQQSQVDTAVQSAIRTAQTSK